MLLEHIAYVDQNEQMKPIIPCLSLLANCRLHCNAITFIYLFYLLL